MSDKKIKKILWIGFAITCPLIQMLFYFAGNWYSLFHNYSIGMVLGIISYVYFLNTLIISSRIRYFDSIFGHDRVLIFHGYMALAAMSAAIAHYFFKSVYISNLTIQTGLGVTGFYIFAAVIVMTLLFMVNTVLSRYRWIQILRKFVINTLRLDYSKLKLFHNCTSVAAIFIALHVLLASSTQENLSRILIMFIWAAVSISLYVYHKVIRVIVAHRRSLVVVDVKHLTSEIVEIKMQRNNNNRIINQYHAGQFGYFRLKSMVCSKEEHPFTISSQPGTGELAITVKNLGDYTATLKDIPVGTNVLFDGPYGTFTPKQDGQHHIFIAGGIGITPFLSIISEWDFNGIKDPLTLIWSARNIEEMIHSDLFTRIESKDSKFLFIPVISRPDNSTTERRHVDRMLLDSVVKKKEIKNTAIYICGPESLRINVIKLLTQTDIPFSNIYYEKFSF